MKYVIAIGTLCFALLSFEARAEGKVIVSIKPLHSLVAAVMEGDDNAPVLLADGKGSLHTFMLKPSQVKELEQADIVFYMGDSFEVFLDKVLDAAPGSIERVAMEKIPGMTLYPLRLGNGFEPHVHEGEEGGEHHHEEGGYDLHLWMSPLSAKLMVAQIAETLSKKYPAKASLYQANAKKLQAKLDVLNQQLRARMAPLKSKPFVVFHDAYQYFEKVYGLDAVGSITLHPERPPTPGRLRDIREKIRTTGAKCVFREPQFNGEVVDNLVAGTGAKSGMLDPEAALIEPGPELYFTLMNNIAAGLEQCLK